MFNPRPGTFFKSRVFFVFFSITVSVILLESSLRFVGVLYDAVRTRSESNLRDRGLEEKENFTILCIGDSYTYGLGAAVEDSYPAQLEGMLNKGRPGKDIRVKNFGTPGSNSRRIRNIFGENIDRYKPDVIIIMVGMNNYWNLEGMHLFNEPSVFERLESNIRGLRIYKLWKLATMNLIKKEHNGIPDLAGDKKTARVANPESEASTGYAELALLLRQAGDHESALDYAKKALENASSDQLESAHIHMELVYIYRAKKDWDMARQHMDHALHRPVFIQSVFTELKNICENKESGLSFDEEVSRIRKVIDLLHGRKGTSMLDALLYLNRNYRKVAQLLKVDLFELISMAKKNDIEVVLMTYPVSILSVNDAIRDTALSYNIALVDNEKIFMQKPNKGEFFNLDRHCNAKGYNLIAENIYSGLVKKITMSEEENDSQ